MTALYLISLILINIIYTAQAIFAHKNKNTDAFFGWACAETSALTLLINEITK